VTDGYQTLGPGGRSLWDAIAEEHELNAGQKVQLLEACRAKDRLDRLDTVLRGDADTWMKLTHRLQTEDYELKIDAALSQANTTANLLKQLLVALRLPDSATGKQPQRRGARGAYKPRGSVTSLDKFRTG
jgi:ABC-type Na+ efflux pump permease subunit